MKNLKLLLLFLLVACQGQTTPESVLRGYVEKRFNGTMGRSDVLAYLSGPMYGLVERMDEATFNNFIDLKEYHLNSLKIIGVKNSEESSFVTYLIDYRVNTAEEGEFNTQVKKVAELVNEEPWKIYKIDNLKTLHKAKKPIDIEAK